MPVARKRPTRTPFGADDAENEVSWPAAVVFEREGSIRWRHLARTHKERPRSAAIFAAL